MGLSTSISHSWASKISNNFVENGNCFTHFFVARPAYLGLMPISLLTTTVDTLAGSVIATGELLTFEDPEAEDVFEYAKNNIQKARKLLVRPYMNLIKIINPNARFQSYWEKKSKVIIFGNGFIFEHLRGHLRAILEYKLPLQNCFLHHVTDRLPVIPFAIVALVARISDATLAVFTVFASILLLGTSQTLNNLAYRTLQVSGILLDFYACMLFLMNPNNVDRTMKVLTTTQPSVRGVPE